MKNLFSGDITLVPSTHKVEGDVIFFNKATKAATNRTLVIAGDATELVANAVKHGGDRKLNVSGKDIGKSNYHTADELADLAKKHQVLALEGYRGSVYLAFQAAPEKATQSKGKKVAADKNAITF